MAPLALVNIMSYLRYPITLSARRDACSVLAHRVWEHQREVIIV